MEAEQASVMVQVLKDAGFADSVAAVELEGTHNKVWETGQGVVKAICSALSER